jgi:hypothetical protein
MQLGTCVVAPKREFLLDCDHVVRVVLLTGVTIEQIHYLCPVFIGLLLHFLTKSRANSISAFFCASFLGATTQVPNCIKGDTGTAELDPG